MADAAYSFPETKLELDGTAFGSASARPVGPPPGAEPKVDTAGAQADIAGYRKQSTDILKRIETNQADRPKAPDVPPPEPPPKPETPTDALSAFGSAASVLAIFGALASRRPLTTALNASANAMKAIRQRDMDTYKQNFETWKAQSEYAGKLAQWQQDQYRNAMDAHKDLDASLRAELTSIAALSQDRLAELTLQTGDWNRWHELMKDREHQVERYQDNRLKLAEFGERQEYDRRMLDLQKNDPRRDAYFSEIAKHPDADRGKLYREIFMGGSQGWQTARDPDTGRTFRYNPGTGEMTQANGDPFPPGQEPKNVEKVMGQPRNAKAMYMAQYIAEHPGADAKELSRASADFDTQRAAEVGFGPTGVVGKQIGAINTAVNHLDTWEKLAKQASAGDVQAINSLWITMKQAILGDPEGPSAQLAAQFVGPEIVKAIVATGGGVTERQALEDSLRTGKLSPRQIEAQRQTAEAFLAGRLEPLRFQYEQYVGGTDFDERFLLPRTRAVLEGKQGGDDISAVATKAWGAYEPDKYDYRISPQGVPQRRLKSGG